MTTSCQAWPRQQQRFQLLWHLRQSHRDKADQALYLVCMLPCRCRLSYCDARYLPDSRPVRTPIARSPTTTLRANPTNTIRPSIVLPLSLARHVERARSWRFLVSSLSTSSRAVAAQQHTTKPIRTPHIQQLTKEHHRDYNNLDGALRRDSACFSIVPRNSRSYTLC